MGTDITVFEEVKLNGCWYNHRRLIWPRNYTFFGILANVRESFDNPVAADRGLPDDVSDLVKYLLRNQHSLSWCIQTELMEATKIASKKQTPIFGSTWKYDFRCYGFINDPDLYDDHFTDLQNYQKRFVFGFDC